MRVVAVNGSPRGRGGNTGAQLEALLAGLAGAGAETATVELAGAGIEPCRGCRACWTGVRRACVQEDRFSALASNLSGADLIVLGTPLYFLDVSGTLKNFIDRLTSLGPPPSAAPPTPSGAPEKARTPRCALVSSCGFPDPAQFDSLAFWHRRFCAQLGLRSAGRFFAAGAKNLSAAAPGSPGRDHLEALAELGALLAADDRGPLEFLDLLRGAG